MSSFFKYFKNKFSEYWTQVNSSFNFYDVKVYYLLVWLLDWPLQTDILLQRAEKSFLRKERKSPKLLTMIQCRCQIESLPANFRAIYPSELNQVNLHSHSVCQKKRFRFLLHLVRVVTLGFQFKILHDLTLTIPTIPTIPMTKPVFKIVMSGQFCTLRKSFIMQRLLTFSETSYILMSWDSCMCQLVFSLSKGWKNTFLYLASSVNLICYLH